MPTTEPHQTWGGRFTTPPDPRLLQLTSSVVEDMRLLEFDLRATAAHARVLSAAGLLDEDALKLIDDSCASLLDKWNRGELSANGYEDVHSFVENHLTETLGDVGRQIHAGRSRNDLIATDLRLWARAQISHLLDELGAFIAELAERAEEHAGTVMPSYTHLQRAQPVSLGFHLAAHGFALLRDGQRFEAARLQADQSSLGAGAVAGTTLDLDPSIGARELGLTATFDNAMDAVADRDFLCDLVYAAAICGVHLSRLCEEIVLWTTSEFGFAGLDDAWATGSSMMPQKKNPDLAELVRARSGSGIGDLVALLTILKALPFAYNRDLQETKPHAFAAADRIAQCLEAARHLVHALTFDTAKLAGATEEGGLWVTDLAERLVDRGVPFREAHETVGRLVADLGEHGTSIEQIDTSVLQSHHSSFEPEDAEVFNTRRGVTARSGPGGPSAERVMEQVALLRERAATLRR